MHPDEILQEDTTITAIEIEIATYRAQNMALTTISRVVGANLDSLDEQYAASLLRDIATQLKAIRTACLSSIGQRVSFL